MCIALHLCCRLHPVLRVPSRCPFRVPELPHVSVASRRPTLVFGRVTLSVWRETCRVLLCCCVQPACQISSRLESVCYPNSYSSGPKVPSICGPKTPPQSGH